MALGKGGRLGHRGAGAHLRHGFNLGARFGGVCRLKMLTKKRLKMDVYKLIREGERRALKAYFSGEPLEQVCRRFGYSRVRIKEMAEDYKSRKTDIFGPMDKKKLGKQFKEVDQ